MENSGSGQNGNNGIFSWGFRDIGTQNRYDWNINNHNTLMFNGNNNNNAQSFYAGTSHVHPDPHLTCLKLGKRHYFEDGSGGIVDGPILGDRHVDGFFPIEKRGRSYGFVGGGVGVGVGGGPSSSSSSSVIIGTALPVPRCQVEGCHVALVNSKDYHRRHKVCELHSKAPKVVVLGIEQRFCQQCSRFHVVSEFDDSKRSCRRRLAGHNERRRKSSNESMSRNHPQEHRSMRLPYITSSTGRALSLLSSKTTSWVSPSDLSSRSSAALRELIAENRAAVLARQLFLDQGWHHHAMDDLGSNQGVSLAHIPHQHQVFPDSSEWERFQEAGGQVTLDLMQEPGSAFGFLSGRTKSKDEEECSQIWKSLEGTHVV
ncbi:hypothetical protein AQUCO_03500165v1 [Aquilegia coerulea]|uniref:SBP-type domain-containing protein n=1 Tax=Aquilegia coerulea TaxID=218851 RepID=A0A2G5CWH0_AQUCA|nr:hypothetical protein AQUCO_03500165v1 [Aquilegia coerulea]